MLARHLAGPAKVLLVSAKRRTANMVLAWYLSLSISHSANLRMLRNMQLLLRAHQSCPEHLYLASEDCKHQEKKRPSAA